MGSFQSRSCEARPWKLIREWKVYLAVIVSQSANHNTEELKPPGRHTRIAEVSANALMGKIPAAW